MCVFSREFGINKVLDEFISLNESNYFTPEDAVEELLGKEFEWRSEKDTTFPKGTTFTVYHWENSDPSAVFHHIPTDEIYTFYNYLLKPKLEKIDGVTHYYPRYGKNDTLETQSKLMEDRQEKIKQRIIHLNNINKNPENDAIYLDLVNKQIRSHKALNTMMIQQTIWNSMDKSFLDVTNHYNTTIGTDKGWMPFLEPNLAKSLAFKESGLGTAGKHLPKHDTGSLLKTRFTVTQAIDSGGQILILQMREYDEAISDVSNKIVTNNNYEDCLVFMEIARNIEKKHKQGLGLSNQKIKITPNDPNSDYYFVTEQDVFVEFEKMAKKFKKGKKQNFWDKFIRNVTNWKDSNWNRNWILKPSKAIWIQAVKDFYKRGENEHPYYKNRRLTYHLWIKAGIRWLFYKRKENNTKTWARTVKYYNYNSPTYSKEIINRNKRAKGKNFIYVKS